MKITKVTVHITASNDNATVDDIRRIHKQQGWSDIGYHWVVDRAGIVHPGRAENITGAHVGGHNTGNIGISYIALGVDNQSNAPYGKFMTAEQRDALEKKIADILYRYDLTIDDVYGHNDFPGVYKACPCFKLRTSQEFKDNVQVYLDLMTGNKSAPEMAEAVDGVDAEVSYDLPDNA